MKKKVKDLTMEEVLKVCKKARTNKKGKESNKCATLDCPLYGCDENIYFFNPHHKKLCVLIKELNYEIEVEDEKDN